MRTAALISVCAIASVTALMGGCAMGGEDELDRGAQAADPNHYEWWRGERVARQAALQAYLDKDGGAGWKAFKNAPVSTTGVPVLLLRVLNDVFPADRLGNPIWGENFEHIGFAKDDFEPGNNLPLGFGWSYASPSTPLGLATLTCGGCHMGRVTGADGKPHHMIGAPSTTFSGYRGALERSIATGRWTYDNFKTAILTKAGTRGWGYFYGEDAASKGRAQTDFYILFGPPNAGATQIPLIAQSVVGRKAIIDSTLGDYTYAPGKNGPSLDAKTPGYLDAIGIGLTAIPSLVKRDAAGSLIFVAPPPNLRVMVDAANVAQLPAAPAMIDMMSVWGQDKRVLAQWDGSINSRLHRNLAAELGVAGSPLVVNFPNAVTTTEFTNHLPPPPYPFDVDEKAAMRGKRLYETHCASCHVSSDNKKVFTDGGTDPNRANIWSSYTRTELLKLLKIACPSSTPACNLPDEEIMPSGILDKSTVGYTAPPLDGIWSRAPYLHNGSVPTIAALLIPSTRPATFYRGNVNYDQAKMGFVSETAAGNAELFDTTLAGLSNKGHDTAAFNGYDIDWTEGHHLADLIAYLKTL